jgi:hypothetical protein
VHSNIFWDFLKLLETLFQFLYFMLILWIAFGIQ